MIWIESIGFGNSDSTNNKSVLCIFQQPHQASSKLEAGNHVPLANKIVQLQILRRTVRKPSSAGARRILLLAARA